MAVKLQVSWSNHTHPLLADPAVVVFPEYPPGSPAQPQPVVLKLKSGTYGIEIPGDPSGFELSVDFHHAMKEATIIKRDWVGTPTSVVLSQTLAPSVTSTLAHARQKYQVRNQSLVALANASNFGISTHPLLSPPGPPLAGDVIPISIFTDFVDVTELWMNRATDSGGYMKLHQKQQTKTRLVALGYTGAGGPLIWFAIVPEICRTQSSVSCLLFFRPTGHYSYSSIEQPHDMYSLNRYLISPDKVEPADAWARGRFFKYYPVGKTSPEMYKDICVGMEAALVNSGKPAVILIPWPSGTNYGIAATADMKEIVKQVFRLLHSKGFIGERRNKVSINGLGIAGFSSGGGQMMLALNRNRKTKELRELYAFDCQGINGVIDWARESDHRLRMTGAFDDNIAANVKMHDELVNKHQKAADQVSAYPRDSTISWEQGKNKWWDYVLWDGQLDPELDKEIRKTRHIRHQFAMFGGNDPDHKQNFLEEFLRNSGL